MPFPQKSGRSLGALHKIIGKQGESKGERGVEKQREGQLFTPGVRMNTCSREISGLASGNRIFAFRCDEGVAKSLIELA